MSKVHCYGKMDWILKYPEDEVPRTSICNCPLVNSCMRITRNNAEKEQRSEDDELAHENSGISLGKGE